ncbi:Bifunctional dethiobiotin synthetase/7,8-diamino-pelargonic acid aminotransferase, mitochondrial [Dionaea muscipula]
MRFLYSAGSLCALLGQTSSLCLERYTGRGLFIEPPTAYMQNKEWNIHLPEGLYGKEYKPEDLTFKLRGELFCKSRDGSNLSRSYASYVSEISSHYRRSEGSSHIGALIIEPGKACPFSDGFTIILPLLHNPFLKLCSVIHGAGGMHMVDPLFQRVLVNECRSWKIPVIFDQVFTGFWRLGVESAAELLHCSPDIACFAKLMTGGIVPLAATLATEAVFDAFMGDSKVKALLHGHSYSAHAMGCTAASRSIRWFKDPKTNSNITFNGKFLRELWDIEIVNEISSHPAVKRLVVLGTLFAIELQAGGSMEGYASTYSSSLLKSLREDGIYMRPLGNVIYLMCGPCTSPLVCTQLLVKVHQRIEEFFQRNRREAALNKREVTSY